MSGSRGKGSPQKSPEEGIKGLEVPAVEYYDVETESYSLCPAASEPAEEGYSYLDALVYMLADERDFLRRMREELDGEVDSLQVEVKRLLGMVEQLQVETGELRTDRARNGDRLKKLSMDVKSLRQQIKYKDAHVVTGMRCVRDAYDAFKKSILAVEAPASLMSDPSVTGRVRVPRFTEEAEGSNAGPGEAPGAAPSEDPRPYMGWCYG